MMARCSVINFKMFAISNDSALYPSSFNENRTTGFPDLRIFSNSSSAFSGVIMIQSILSKSNSETLGNINSGLSIGSGVYVTVFGVDEHALRPVIRISDIRTFVVDL